MRSSQSDTDSEVELVTEWLREYCALPAADDDGPPAALRVDVLGGPSRSVSRARKVAHGVVLRPGADAAATAGTLVRRLSMARADGHRFVFLSVMATGSRHPLDALSLDGDPSASAEGGVDDEGAAGLASSRGFLAIIADNREMRRELMQAYAAGAEAMIQVARYETASASYDERAELEKRALIAEQVQQAVSHVAPYLPAILGTMQNPKAAAADTTEPGAASSSSAQPTSEPDPMAAAEAIVQAIEGLGAAVTAARAAGRWTPDAEASVRARLTPHVLDLIRGPAAA